MKKIHDVLKKLGLNEKEIAIYLVLLSIGTAPASVLGHRTNIKRSTARYTCQQLHKKGLVSMIQKGETQLFSYEPPEKLKLLLQKRQEELKRKENQVDQIIGDLKRMISPHAVLPKVQFFEGEEEMIRLYERFLDLRQPIDSFEEAGELFEIFPDYPQEFVRKRVERKIPNRCIAPKGNPLNVSDPDQLIKVKYVDQEQFPFSWHVKICGNLVGIFSFQKHASMAIVIEHEDIAKNFRLLFEMFWQMLKD